MAILISVLILWYPVPTMDVNCKHKDKGHGFPFLGVSHETINCPYKDVGCTCTLPRRIMADHKATSCGPSSGTTYTAEESGNSFYSDPNVTIQ